MAATYCEISQTGEILQFLSTNQPFTLGNMNHPVQVWKSWSEEEKRLRNLVPVVRADELTPDQRNFFINTFEYHYDGASDSVLENLKTSVPKPEKAALEARRDLKLKHDQAKVLSRFAMGAIVNYIHGQPDAPQAVKDLKAHLEVNSLNFEDVYEGL